MLTKAASLDSAAELTKLRASTEHLVFITRTFAALRLHDRGAVCDTLLNMAATFVESDVGAIMLVDGDEAVVTVRGEFEAAALVAEESRVAWRAVVEERRARLIPIEELARLWPSVPSAFSSGALCCNLDVHDQPVGIMLLQPRPMVQNADLNFMSAVCALGALAIASADAITFQHELLRASKANAAATENFAERVTSRMHELGRGQCTLSNLTIERERDPRARVVFAGLYRLYNDWQDQARLREEAETETRAREARYRALFDLARVCIWDCDLTRVVAALRQHGASLDAYFAAEPARVRELARHLRVRAVNRQTLELFPVSSAESLPSELTHIIVDESLPMFWQLWSALARGERKLEMNGVLGGRNGELRNVIFGVTVPNEQGLAHAIVTVSDITPIHEARQAAEELARVRAQEIDRINDEVERLFYAVSHDLRSPLQAVINLVEFANEDLASKAFGDVKGHLDLIRDRATRLNEMLNDLLSYAKAGRTHFVAETVRVDDVLREIHDSLLTVPEGFEVRWTPMPTIYTQATLLSQVLLNLIGNAIKHHDRDGGVIEVSSTDVGGAYELRVADDGPGIPSQYRDKVFAMFSTLRRRDEVEGSGMGLALVRKVVLACGGTVAIESNAPRGTVFVVTWPKTPVVNGSAE